MNQLAKLVNFALVLLQLIDTINSVELTFELPDNSKECFYQDIAKNKSAVLEFQVGYQWKEICLTISCHDNTKLLNIADNTFQVITGGQYDVDVELMAPNKEIIYKQIKSQFDSHQFTAAVS